MTALPPNDPETNWRPKYYFAAAVLKEFAWLYPTLKPGRYYPTAYGPPPPAKNSLSEHWLMPTYDPATWVMVPSKHSDFHELIPGDAWEGESIQPMDPPG